MKNSNYPKQQELKTCPFCDSDAQFVRPAGMFPPKFVVVCKNADCKASIGSYSPTKAEAANKWNTRVAAAKTTHSGCKYCPVGCNEYERNNGYRGSGCAAARAKAGVDYDPEDVFDWEESDNI